MSTQHEPWKSSFLSFFLMHFTLLARILAKILAKIFARIFARRSEAAHQQFTLAKPCAMAWW